MRPISRTALGVATAAVLAVTAVAPSVAAPAPTDPASGKRPITGSAKAGDGRADGQGRSVVVTLVTGDKIQVWQGSSGPDAATALPRADGTIPLVQTRTTGSSKDLYVFPESASDALASGRVDRELFNVSGLIRQGYDDAHTTALPLIAVYDDSVNVARTLPAAPRAATRGPVLKAVGGVALKADKAKAADFWADVTDTRSRAASDLAKLWLDRKVKANLDRSTQQVNAPAAWAAGFDGKGTKVAVLDTGADAEHPDLKGRIAAAQNFTDSAGTGDVQGHGTHTGSTVGGSGAASGGTKKGVAPGTQLLNGKVLNDGGSGAESWIIAGMQWAVDQKADVVSMSLGSPVPTDCTDPLSTAAEELAKSKHTLFVVAAGNLGPRLNSVSSPGCAPGVLTVGAVDRDDSTAPFSSRGPSTVGHTLKPEIAAPGVAISAAAAGGRGVYAYQSMSGTSMAAPHVAGAAALLRQAHPDWSAQQLKAALVSSAKVVPGDVRETGGGRLDIKAALDPGVTGTPALQGGTFDWPQHSSDRTTVDVPYTNVTDKPVTLDLTVQQPTGNDGSKIRSRIARLGKDRITVPAGASVTVPLTLDPAARLDRAQYGDVTGRILATARGGVRVSTPFSLYVQPETVTLRVKVVDRSGKPADGPSTLDVVGTDDEKGESRYNDGAAEQRYEVRPGAYFLSSYVTTPDVSDATGRGIGSLSYLAHPQLEIKKDTTVVLDARTAHRLDVRTDRPGERRSTTLSFDRSWKNTWRHAGTLSAGRNVPAFYADIKGRATQGDFEFGSYWRLYAPLLSSLKVKGGPALHAVTGGVGSVNLDGRGSAGLADAGKGTPEELKAADVKGRIALVEVADDEANLSGIASNARAEGAVAVLAHRPSAGTWYPGVNLGGGSAVPVLAVPAAEGKDLKARLGAGAVALDWQGTARSPYVYNLAHHEQGPLNAARTYRSSDRRLASVRTTHGAMGVAGDYIDSVDAVRPNGTRVFTSSLADPVPAPGTRTDFYSADGSGWGRTVSSSFPFGELMVSPHRVPRSGQQRTESWYGSVVAPTAPRDDQDKPVLVAERQGNLIGFADAMWGDREHWAIQGGFGDIGNLRLKRDGKVVGETGWPSGVFDVPADKGTYELTQQGMKFGSPAELWKRSTSIETTWKFTSQLDESAYSTPLPIIFPGYEIPEDGLKTLPAANGQKITLTASGHAGYTPGSLTAAALSYSYDEGKTWNRAKTTRSGGSWTALVDHAGATGKQVTLKTELTDARGNSVTQLVTRAYDVR
ncbi:S8 family serine peptidase [Streptomyces sp. NBC_00237]|uniref:S8 family peptidase n=1 Tax=Streptomyces sp. NBC_00237 TaxID=2975687 RepID=UPI002258F54C|nr:S8 family serine peptidase [Streptomyces sp. NBC_00237]MCX5203378.1 S8 family serine peptidase [Streptomyces sp. NBC_00237]